MMTSTRGLSLIEVMIAMVILAVGILAMGATAGAVTTTLTGSRAATQASQMAMGEIEKLRVAARSTKPACSAATFSSSVGVMKQDNVSMTWTVPPSGQSREVQVSVTYPMGRGRTKTEVFRTLVPCP